LQDLTPCLRACDLVLSPLREIDKWVRRKLRCYLWKQWGSAGYRELRKRGVTVREAWNTSKSARPMAVVEDTGIGHCATIALLHQLGNYGDSAFN
jgi:hypothetical protein